MTIAFNLCVLDLDATYEKRETKVWPQNGTGREYVLGTLVPFETPNRIIQISVRPKHNVTCVVAATFEQTLEAKEIEGLAW